MKSIPFVLILLLSRVALADTFFKLRSFKRINISEGVLTPSVQSILSSELARNVLPSMPPLFLTKDLTEALILLPSGDELTDKRIKEFERLGLRIEPVGSMDRKDLAKARAVGLFAVFMDYRSYDSRPEWEIAQSREPDGRNDVVSSNPYTPKKIQNLIGKSYLKLFMDPDTDTVGVLVAGNKNRKFIQQTLFGVGFVKRAIINLGPESFQNYCRYQF